ncbi:hypothetical protein B9K03_12100, partial [Rothia sp. Olga]
MVQLIQLLVIIYGHSQIELQVNVQLFQRVIPLLQNLPPLLQLPLNMLLPLPRLLLLLPPLLLFGQMMTMV